MVEVVVEVEVKALVEVEVQLLFLMGGWCVGGQVVGWKIRDKY